MRNLDLFKKIKLIFKLVGYVGTTSAFLDKKKHLKKVLKHKKY